MLIIVQGGIQTQMHLFPKSLPFLLNYDVFIYLCGTGEDGNDTR